MLAVRDHYVTEQMARSASKAADALTDEERKHACVVANAGRPLSPAGRRRTNAG